MSYTFSAGQILTAADLNNVFAQTSTTATNASTLATGTIIETVLPYRMNQNVRTTDSVTFNDMIVSGNLTVSGTTTYVNTATLDVKDKNITIAKGAANSAAANGAGITIEGANVNFQYDDSSNMMLLDHLLSVGNSTVNAIFGYQASQLAGGQFIGNVNNYFQVIATNANTGTSASGDFVVADDQGISSNSYVDMGINSSLWSNTLWTINGPSDSYLYAHGGSLAIGTAENYETVFFANGTLDTNEAMRIDSGANVNIGNTKGGSTSLTVGNTSVNVTVNSTSITVSSSLFHTAGLYPGSNSQGNELGSNTKRWSFTGNTINASGLITGTAGLDITGMANVSANLTVSDTVKVGANVSLSTTTINVGNSTINTSITAGQILLSGATLNSTSYAGTANNSTYLAGVNSASYVTNTGNYTLSGIITHTSNIVMDGAAAKIVANGSFGNVNYVLSSNGTGMYWADLTVSSVNTLAEYVWTNTHTHGNTTQQANVVMANGYILGQTINASSFTTTNVSVNATTVFVSSNSTTNTVIEANNISLNGANVMTTATTLKVYYANNLQAFP